MVQQSILKSHSATTNELGLVNLSIGDGGVMSRILE